MALSTLLIGPERRRRWCCQSNGNSSPLGRNGPKPKGGLSHDCAPLGQSGGASFFVKVSADEVTLLLKMIVDLGVDGRELLDGLHPSKSDHCALSSSEREVGILELAVQLAPGLLVIAGANRFEGGAIGTQPVGGDGAGPAVAFNSLLDEFQRRELVSRLRVVGFKHLALVVYRPPEVAHLAVDLHVDFIQAPSPVGERAHVLNPFPADPTGKHRTETASPQPDHLGRRVEPSERIVGLLLAGYPIRLTATRYREVRLH